MFIAVTECHCDVTEGSVFLTRNGGDCETQYRIRVDTTPPNMVFALLLLNKTYKKGHNYSFLSIFVKIKIKNIFGVFKKIIFLQKE